MAIGSRVFTDEQAEIESVAPELANQAGIRFPRGGPSAPIEFEAPEPVRVLVGYYQSSEKRFLKVPDLETDAAAIDVIDAEPVLQNVATIRGMPAINVHVFRYGAGKHVLDVRGHGEFVVLGVVPQNVKIERRDCGRQARTESK
ncbi:MAG: hypothetical protein QM770_10200 [Tepidisphaeraceae bacterium]